MVEARQQTHGFGDRCRRQLVEIAGENVSAFAVDVDLAEPIANGTEPRSKLPRADPAAGYPIVEVLHSRGPVRAEVGDDRDRRCLVGLGKADPARARVLRADEGHAIPSAWPEAEVALPCVWLEQRAPARAERVAEVTVAASRDDRRDELLSGEGPPIKCVANDLAKRVELLWGDAEILLPAWPFP